LWKVTCSCGRRMTLSQRLARNPLWRLPFQ
jgi:hypothetical protein